MERSNELESQLLSYVQQQIQINKLQNQEIHNLLLARHLLGFEQNFDEDVKIIRSELKIQKRPTKKSEKSVEMLCQATQTTELQKYLQEPQQKSDFDDFFVTKKSTKPATFESAADMLQGPAQQMLPNQIKQIADNLQKQKSQQAQLADQPSKNSYIQKFLQQNPIETPLLSFKDIFGMEEVKKQLAQCIILPIKRPELFTSNQIQRKILLYSLPGTGKTFIVKCIAGEMKLPLISLQSSSIFNKYIGESEKFIKAAFQLAKERQPCIVFIDEIDSLAKTRTDSDSETNQRVKNELLQLIDGLEQQNITFIGASNLPYMIDSAVIRRFNKRIFVNLPDLLARKSYFSEKLGDFLLKNGKDTISNIIDQIAQMTENYNFSDLKNVVNAINNLHVNLLLDAEYFVFRDEKWEICDKNQPDAVRTPLTDLVGPVRYPEITEAQIIEKMSKIKSSVNSKDVEKLMRFKEDFGAE